MKKLVLILFFTLIFLGVPKEVSAQRRNEIYFYYSTTCPHCAKANDFLIRLQAKNSNLIVHRFPVDDSSVNQRLFMKQVKRFQIQVPGVPLIVIGNSYLIGYQDDLTTGQTIEELLQKKNQTETKEKDLMINLPFIGRVDTLNLSLPMLTVVLAALDGFNPCAMWTLLFLISLLLGMEDRRRMWILGGSFILTSAVVYFLFLAAWLNLFIFLGFVPAIRMMVGILAVVAGGYYLFDFAMNKNGRCKLAGGSKRKAVFIVLKDLVQSRFFMIAVIGIIVLAIVVNLIELICSAGLPAIYTQVLSLSKLSTWEYYSYLTLYVLVFMLDDLFVFFSAMFTLRLVGVEGKYARYSHLVGGFLILIIGFLLLFVPAWLNLV